METQSIASRWKRRLISIFVLVNLLTVLWINQPEAFSDAKSKWIDRQLPPNEAYQLRYAAWRWSQYAHYAGLDNRWQMFGRQSRFNWWYDIRAVYSDGVQESTVSLPLPNQSARTFMQRTLFDLKERKFELNIYLNPVARESYSRYLARQFPTHHGMPIQSVRWHLGTQAILPPAEAVAKHKLHDDSAHVQLLNDFNVAPYVGAVSSSNLKPGREWFDETAIADATQRMSIEACQ
jgi:hypothetical protein